MGTKIYPLFVGTGCVCFERQNIPTMWKLTHRHELLLPPQRWISVGTEAVAKLCKKEERRQKAAHYYLLHQADIKLKRQEHYNKAKGQISASRKKWYQDNREKVLQAKKERYTEEALKRREKKLTTKESLKTLLSKVDERRRIKVCGVNFVLSERRD